MNTISNTTEVRTTLEDALAHARAKPTQQLTKFENLLLGFANDPNPKKLDVAQREASATFHTSALKRQLIADAKAAGALAPMVELATADVEDRLAFATALVDIMRLYGRKFWS